MRGPNMTFFNGGAYCFPGKYVLAENLLSGEGKGASALKTLLC